MSLKRPALARAKCSANPDSIDPRNSRQLAPALLSDKSCQAEALAWLFHLSLFIYNPVEVQAASTRHGGDFPTADPYIVPDDPWRSVSSSTGNEDQIP